LQSPGKRPRIRTFILTVVLLGAGVAALVHGVVSSFRVTCEVCLTYGGRAVCRVAVGSSREEAARIARGRACEFLTVDGAAEEECLRVPADSVSFQDD
jgi:hypothetical protein